MGPCPPDGPETLNPKARNIGDAGLGKFLAAQQGERLAVLLYCLLVVADAKSSDAVANYI